MLTFRQGALCAMALVTHILHADIVTLTDGRIVEGEIVSETPTEIVVQQKSSKTTIARDEIQSIEKRKSIAAFYSDKIESLERSKDKKNKEAWLDLAIEAKRKGAKDETPIAYQHVIAIDPDDAIAREALGYVKSKGEWKLKGDVKKGTEADAGAANGDAQLTPEVLELVERAEREADAQNLDKSFKFYQKALQANSSIALRHRFADFFFNCAERIRESHWTEFSAAAAAALQSRDGAYKDVKSMAAGKYKKFNPDDPAFLKAKAVYQEQLKKIAVCFPLYERAEENYAAIVKASPDGKNFDAAAHQVLCLTVRNDEVYTEARAKKLLIAFITDYKPSNPREQQLYDRCKVEFDKRDK